MTYVDTRIVFFTTSMLVRLLIQHFLKAGIKHKAM